MKSVWYKVLTLMLACLLLVNSVSPMLAVAADNLLSLLADGESTTVSPEGYVGIRTGYGEHYKQEKKQGVSFALMSYNTPENVEGDGDENEDAELGESEETKKVLLVEDVLPWKSNANSTVLSKITDFKKVTTKGFLEENLSEYGVIIFANDQPFDSYDNYIEFKEYMELFASIGGVIVFGACDQGWSQGNLNTALPGDVTKNNHYETNNYIVDSNHTIITGALTDEIALQDDDLQSRYCSHISFNEDSFPAGTKILIRESKTNKPTLIEYPLGRGRVIASGLTWEHNYSRKGETISGVKVGGFSERALDDLYSYAIRVSSIDVNELHQLDDWVMEYKAHKIIVADSSDGIANMTPVKGASVSIDGEAFTTDENGMVTYYETGVKTVSVSAPGFRERKHTYYLGECTSQIFYLEPAKGDGLPYVTQSTASTGEKNVYLDVRDQVLNFTKDSTKPVIICVDGNWNGHTEGCFIIYQEAGASGPGKQLTVYANQYVNFMPGKVFDCSKPVKIKMIAGDGTESEPIKLNIKVNKAPDMGGNDNTELKEGVGDFDWFGRYPVNSDNEVFDKLLTSDFSISSDLLPIEIKKVENDDGTVTYRGILGLKSGNVCKNILNSKTAIKKDSSKNNVTNPVEESWDTWKSEIKRFKKAGNAKGYLDSIKKKYGKDWHATKLRAAFDIDVKVAGYLEIKLDSEEKNVLASEGGFIVETSAKVTIGQTYMAGPVPVYYEFIPSVELGFEGGIGINCEDGIYFYPNLNNAELKLPKISIEGGVGVRGVATAGIKGEGALVFKDKNGQSSGELEFSAGVHIKALFVVDYNWTFAKSTISLWPKNKSQNISYDAFNEFIKNPQNAVIGFADRSYIDNRSLWNGEIGAVLGANSNTFSVLQYGVMPDALPVLHQLGDKQIMLMLQDDGSNTVGNHTKLVYSVNTNGYWSSPIEVYSSSGADFFFDSKVVGDKLYVVWQKSKKEVGVDSPENILNEVAANSEICMAVMSNADEGFASFKYVTDNNVVDMMPSISAIDNGISIAWVSNSENALFGNAGTSSVNIVNYVNGNFSSVSKVVDVNGFIAEISNGGSAEAINVIYSVAADNGAARLYYSDGKNSREISTSGTASALQHLKSNFYWQENGDIYTFNTSGSQKLISGDAISSNYQLVSNGNELAVVWIESGETTDIKAVLYMDGRWCEPITLLGGIEETVNFYHATMMDDGSFAFVLNTAKYNDNGVSDTNLKYGRIYPSTKIAMTGAYPSMPDWANGKQNVDVYVENNGSSVIEQVKITVRNENGNLYEATQAIKLYPGESKTVTVNVDLSNLKKTSDCTIVVTVDEDDTSDDNETVVTLGQVDIRVVPQVYEREKDIVFVLTIANSSKLPANVAVGVYEDELDGIQLDIKGLGSIASESAVQYVYAIDKSKVKFTETGIKTYFFNISSLEEDWTESDNYCCYSVIKDNYEVTDPNGAMESVELVDPQSIELSVTELVFSGPEDDPVQLEAWVTPDNASVTHIVWSVEDADVVHITSGGLVTPLRNGTTTITATVLDKLTVSITVTVGPVSEETAEVTEDENRKNLLWVLIIILVAVPVLLVVLVILIISSVKTKKKNSGKSNGDGNGADNNTPPQT